MNKFCPFNKSECLSERCMCYIKITKPSYESSSHRILDPTQYYKYEGCGLVTSLPYQVIHVNPRICAKLENIEK
jgi:hypothetical protein